MFVSNMYVEGYFCEYNLSYGRGMGETTVSADSEPKGSVEKEGEKSLIFLLFLLLFG